MVPAGRGTRGGGGCGVVVLRWLHAASNKARGDGVSVAIQGNLKCGKLGKLALRGERAKCG